MTEDEMFALCLISSNAVLLESATRAIGRFNAGVPGLLAAELIDYAPRLAVAYKLTAKGKAALADGSRK